MSERLLMFNHLYYVDFDSWPRACLFSYCSESCIWALQRKLEELMVAGHGEDNEDGEAEDEEDAEDEEAEPDASTSGNIFIIVLVLH